MGRRRRQACRFDRQSLRGAVERHRPGRSLHRRDDEDEAACLGGARLRRPRPPAHRPGDRKAKPAARDAPAVERAERARRRGAIATADRRYFHEVLAKRQQIINALVAHKPTGAAGAEWIAIPNRSLEPIINVANTAFDLTIRHAADEADVAQRYFLLALLLMLFFAGFGLYGTGLVIRRVARPMARITAAVRSVAAGDLAGVIPFAERDDEIGDLARALAVFRANAEAKQRMEGELIRQERLSAVGQLTATVAHELRNPLAAIRNCAYLLREMVGGTGELERPVARIERSVARCENIIGDLLSFTRMRDLERAPVAVDEWLDELLGEQKLPDGVALSRNLGAPGRRLDLDAERMRQVIINLVDNAAQAMSEQTDAARER